MVGQQRTKRKSEARSALRRLQHSDTMESVAGKRGAGMSPGRHWQAGSARTALGVQVLPHGPRGLQRGLEARYAGAELSFVGLGPGVCLRRGRGVEIAFRPSCAPRALGPARPTANRAPVKRSQLQRSPTIPQLRTLLRLCTPPSCSGCNRRGRMDCRHAARPRGLPQRRSELERKFRAYSDGWPPQMAPAARPRHSPHRPFEQGGCEGRPRGPPAKQSGPVARHNVRD